MAQRARRCSALSAWFALALASCDRPQTTLFDDSLLSAGTGTYVGCSGVEGCSCYPNSTCNSGLVCRSRLCLIDGSVGAGGNDVSRGGAGAGAGSGTTTVAAAGAGGNAGNATGGQANSVAGSSAGSNSNGSSGATGVGGAPPRPIDTGLITNGDFSQGSSHWTITAVSGGPLDVAFESARLCVSLGQYQTIAVGWPDNAEDAFPLEAGVAYQLSFLASAEGAQLSSAKVGHAISPFWSDFETRVTVTSSLERSTFSFVPPFADPQAGLVFYLFGSASTLPRRVCLDDVTLEKAAATGMQASGQE